MDKIKAVAIIPSRLESSRLPRKALIDICIKNNVDYFKPSTFSCGSGVTACVLGLAYSLINDRYFPAIYDGSWAEYGKLK